MKKKPNTLNLPLKAKTGVWLGRRVKMILDGQGTPIIELTDKRETVWKGYRLVRLMNRIAKEAETNESLRSIFKEVGVALPEYPVVSNQLPLPFHMA